MTIPLYREDETLTDNLTDDMSLRLLTLTDKIGIIRPECIGSFLKVVRMINNLAQVTSVSERDRNLKRIVWVTGITVKNIQVPREHLIQQIIEDLEINYEPKE